MKSKPRNKFLFFFSRKKFCFSLSSNLFIILSLFYHCYFPSFISLSFFPSNPFIILYLLYLCYLSYFCYLSYLSYFCYSFYFSYFCYSFYLSYLSYLGSIVFFSPISFLFSLSSYFLCRPNLESIPGFNFDSIHLFQVNFFDQKQTHNENLHSQTNVEMKFFVHFRFDLKKKSSGKAKSAYRLIIIPFLSYFIG